MIEHYTSTLGLYETQSAIGFIQQTFQFELSRRLHLIRATAPLFVDPATGLNDDLSGKERAVSFDIPGVPEITSGAQVVHSLAKWKRMALGTYGFQPDTGLWTDMNAIRRDEIPDAVHSIYVDQWDWEKVITPEMRNEKILRETVTEIVDAICATLSEVKMRYPQIAVELSREVSFVTAQELLNRYPSLSGKQREDAYVREHPTTFIMQIGGKLSNGQPHDGRAPDYDDWLLNGDLLFWDPVLERSIELSSMGIRVDAQRMQLQCQQAGCPERLALPFHQSVLRDELPLSMGGGIGQSRLCMLLLGKAHIGEVQVSLWPKEMVADCASKGIHLL